MVDKKVFVIAGGCGLPAITWALLAWEPFGRLLAHFFPEMFYDEVGRFVPLMSAEALGITIFLTVCAAVPIVAILLIYGAVRSVQQNGAERTARTVENGAQVTVVGIVTVLSSLWMATLGAAGFAARGAGPRYDQYYDEFDQYKEKNYLDLTRMAEWEPWEYTEYDQCNRSQDANHISDKYTSFH